MVNVAIPHLSLFSGIGGIDLAAHWAGFQTVGLVESDAFCRAVLAKNFPGVPIFDDINTFDSQPFWGIPLLSGGFPCQDLSDAGAGKGLDGIRSGLWFRMLDVVRATRPAYVLAENVRGILSKPGMGGESAIDTVLSGLESEGYEVRAFVLGAWSAGAPHRRNRVFIVAERRDLADLHRDREQQSERSGREVRRWAGDRDAAGVALGDACRVGCRGQSRGGGAGAESANGHRKPETAGMDNADCFRLSRCTCGVTSVTVDDGQDNRLLVASGPGPELRDATAQRMADAERESIGADARQDQRDGRTTGRAKSASIAGDGRALAYAAGGQLQGSGGVRAEGRAQSSNCRAEVADADHAGRREQCRTVSGAEELRASELGCGRFPVAGLGRMPDGISGWLDGLAGWFHGWPAGPHEEQHPWEPPRLATGVPYRQARLRALGNAVVPQQVYPILAAIADRYRALHGASE